MVRHLRLRHRALGGVLALFLAATSAGGAAADSGTDRPRDDRPPATAAGEAPRGRVLAISLDGLTPRALRRLGRSGTPNLHRLLARGAATLNARTQVEKTVTLPNHASMITGRAIAVRRDGHGVTWNSHIPGTTVQESSGDPTISSVFSVVHDAGGATALFSTKSKFSLFERSWPQAVDRQVIRVEDDAAVVRALRRDLVRHQRAFTFLHLGLADQIGHERGWMSRPYLRAIRRLDRLVGRVLATRDRHRALRRQLRIVLTADHGGVPGTKSHADRRNPANYRVPFLIWGRGVDAGDLYAMNPEVRRDPGAERPRFAGVQPVRNGEVADLSLDLLGLGPVPDSRWNAGQDLSVTAP